MIVILLFFLSGATALVYEVVWSKYLSQMFGSTVQAQTVVLAVFMGGLALGNRLFGRMADRARQPLVIYGYLEIAIGLYAFLFTPLFHAMDAMFVAVGNGRLDSPLFLLLVKATLAVALLLGPTLLMGGTLPLLASWLQRHHPDAGRWSARFYSINSLGAVVGAGFAGFLLVRSIGLVSTLQMTALVNVLVGVAAIAVVRYGGDIESHGSESKTEQLAAAADNPAVFRAGCLLVAFTGAVSMGLEVLASRSLALIFGASLQAFAVVLMAFILGIGLGSAVVASPRFHKLNWAFTTFTLLLAAACWIGFLVMAIEQWVDVYRHLRTGLGRTDMGYRYHQLLTGGLSMIVLGIPAALLGAVLPLCIRAVSDGSNALGNRVGRLLTWNTIGAVVGVLATGFVLMPAVGLRGSFATLAVVLCLVAAIVGVFKLPRRSLAFPGAAIGFLVAVIVLGGDTWRHVMTSGVFRARETEVDSRVLDFRREHMKILFYEDAADATVSVEQGDGTNGRHQIGLRVNGKPDASSEGDLATQFMLAHAPMLARPDSKDVFVLGLGSGITAGALLGHPVEQVVVAENCEPVVRAAEFFNPWNQGVLTNSRVRIRYEDGRTILKLSLQEYDVIISEPSNPWMAGVGSVFSQEFYELCASRLKEGGIMAQWFHVYEMSDTIVTMVLRTFGKVFPNIEIWDVAEGDIILLGSKEPWASGPEVFRRVYERELPRKNLEAIGLPTPESAWTRQLASQRTAFAISGPGPIQSDAFPILEYEAPKAFYIGHNSRALLLYDERTWQAPLAPKKKRAALARLDVESVRAAFKEYPSCNVDLGKFLAARIGAIRAGDPEGGFDPNALPSVFLPFSTNRYQLMIPADASPVLAELLTAQHTMRMEPRQWREQAVKIGSALSEYKPAANNEDQNWKPGYFIMDAARVSLSHGDADLARKLVALGLTLEPNAPELHYLSRVLERYPKAAHAAG